jgi:hypothetical protein
MNDLKALVRGAAGSKMWRVRATAGVDGRVSGLLPIRSGPSAAWLCCSSTSKSSSAGPLPGWQPAQTLAAVIGEPAERAHPLTVRRNDRSAPVLDR